MRIFVPLCIAFAFLQSCAPSSGQEKPSLERPALGDSGALSDRAGATTPDQGLATPLPLSREAVQSLGPGSQLDGASVSWQQDQTTYLLFESFNELLSKGSFFLSRATNGRFSQPTPFTLTLNPIVGSPSRMRWRGSLWLYFAEASTLQGPMVVKRCKIVAGQSENPETLPTLPGAANLLSRPQFFAWSNTALVAYKDQQSRPVLATSSDGKTFSSPLLLYKAAVTSARLGMTQEKALVYVYQHAKEPEAMLSHYRVSSDGKRWTVAQTVSKTGSTISDATVLARPDSGADLYYAVSKDRKVRSLFRRRVSSDGALGPEQQLTHSALGDASKPETLRLADGRILLSWIETTKRNAQENPSEQRLLLAIIRGDAPL